MDGLDHQSGAVAILDVGRMDRDVPAVTTWRLRPLTFLAAS
jgi:hypothetical protein